MGGKTAMFLSESHPDRVAALVVIDIAPTSYTPGEESSQAATHRMILEAMLKVDFSRARTRKDIEVQLAADVQSPKIRKFLLKNIRRTTRQGYEWKINVPVLHQNLQEILKGLDRTKYSGGEEIAGFPVLFIRGEKSDYIMDDDILVIHQIYPMARVTTLPDAGHWLHVEQPSLLIRTIRYFL
jgi:pimeloyl-ACP methyl ester carboxylesterase